MSPIGIESVGGLVEKHLPVIRFPVVMRIVLPGALAAAALFPLLGLPADFATAQSLTSWRRLLLIAMMVFVLGVFISVMNDQTYKVYEGRILWPRALSAFCTGRQQARVRKLLDKAEEAKASKDSLRRAEMWYQLRRYPLDDAGKPFASHPTLLGNILAGYEDYPNSRYGMDSVFYWYRIWLALDKEKKDDIDASWSVADGLLSLSAVSFAGSVLWMAIVLLRNFQWVRSHLPFEHSFIPLVGGLFLFFLGYGFYRVSIPYHRGNGEIYKAIFDLYRERLATMTKVGPKESEIWEGTWSYLQYLQVHCMNCRKYHSSNLARCPFCACPTITSLRELQSAGFGNHSNEL